MTTIRGCLAESALALRVTHGVRSKLRLILDIWLSRILAAWPSAFQSAKVRTIRCHPDVTISYRLNRGDLQSIREVWGACTYRLPKGRQPRILVDLGSNIGLASLWIHKTYGCERIIAVEADEENARLAATNFRNNGLPAELIHAAAGPHDGKAVFAKARESNQGHIVNASMSDLPDSTVVEVPMVSMETVLKSLPENVMIDVVKLDIEGGEEALMKGPRSWLRRVRYIIAELHPGIADCDAVRQVLEEEGFVFRPVNSDFPGSMSAFARPESE